MARRTHAFGRLLAAARKEQGFRTPFALFRGCGGSRGLGLNYGSYLSLEKGGSLPKPRRLLALLSALGLKPQAERGQDLVRAYLRDLFGSDEFLGALSPRGLADAASDWGLAKAAAKQAIGLRQAHLSLEQYRFLARDRAAYACHMYLKCTAGWQDRREVARTVGESRSEAERALKALAKAGLIKASGSRVRSNYERKFMAPLAATPATAAIHAAITRHRSALASRKGSVFHRADLILRAPRRQMEAYFRHLADMVRMSSVYADSASREDSEVYLVEGRVSRIFAGTGRA